MSNDVWYDEDNDEVVIELDGKNEFLNNILKEARDGRVGKE